MVYRPEIDGLRAIAVIAVVGYHYGLINAVFSQGYIGVDIFFVISGYLITQVLVSSIGQKKWLINFYLRRVRRILPVLLLVILTTFVVGLLLLLPFELRQLGKQIFFVSLFSGNLYFWSEIGYFDSDASQKPLLHLWSLGVEEQFYILFPLIIFFAIKTRKKFNFYCFRFF
jgi:peptidoglycan/LPS O-acetylase OafA/YrhL